MTLEEIGRLALDERLAQVAFKNACDRYDEAFRNGSDNVPSYELERLAAQSASEKLRVACDAYIQG